MSIPQSQKVLLIDGLSEGYEVIKYEDFATPIIVTDDEVIIKNRYTGVNYIESYFRKGIYPAELPYVLGREAVGTVVAIGKSVRDLKVGDKVSYIAGATFAQFTKVPNSTHVFKLPDTTSTEQLKLYAAGMIQGLTALTFVNEAYDVKKGDYVLLYAAAGGVGLIFNQLLRMRGAHTIAVASTNEKLSLAKENGAEFLINSKEDNILEKVQQITKGNGVDVAFDSVGKDTFETTLSCLKRKGTFVSYGNASGPVPPFPLSRLSPKNIRLLRPQLFGYVAQADEFRHYTEELISLIDSGKLNIKLFKIYQLYDYVQAAKDIESRSTTGKLILEVPQ
ncbi:hypothetical protein KAFR_0C00580 [Kazachstania africana CBS 2517]|uniref:Probable quinone oxidoreductase n=1 Tax=Kazachstania africana (strain ATCC 22294 / BCRC 22015 / CBS 2517 / CECT 1963 / NBRC 1671 / NRRL Y-8276) TaxID=1071382 RepID=H2ARQ3_KAZAF|nr:hypothetical protein KAFR_0C00580 [Kazachstania africana CBS 2517]CCF57053.1 hypothetical protein KAFR_0C00580 [Kazachstania africana CBS 2517]